MQDVLNRTTDAFRKGDLHLASKVEPLESRRRRAGTRHQGPPRRPPAGRQLLHRVRLRAGRPADQLRARLRPLQQRGRRPDRGCAGQLRHPRIPQRPASAATLPPRRASSSSAVLNRYRERYLFPNEAAPDETEDFRQMIYIVEDDAAIRELEQYALQSSGYEADRALRPRSRSGRPCTLPRRRSWSSLDVMLPGEDGFSILKKLRNTPSLRRLPAVTTTEPCGTL